MQTAHLRTSALHVDQEKRNAINRKRHQLKLERKNKAAAADALAAAKLEAADFAAKVAAAVAQAAHKEMTSRNECAFNAHASAYQETTAQVQAAVTSLTNMHAAQAAVVQAHVASMRASTKEVSEQVAPVMAALLAPLMNDPAIAPLAGAGCSTTPPFERRLEHEESLDESHLLLSSAGSPKKTRAHALTSGPVHSNELPDGIEPDEDEEAMMLSLLLRSARKVARASRLALLLSSCMPDQKNPLTL